jgi:FkbM family methyltransferase
MKQRVLFTLRLINKFGFWNGLWLSIRFGIGSIENIQLPNISHPLSLRPRSSDTQTFYQVFLADEYKIDFVKNPKVIIDGGANIGLFSIKMKNEFPDATIVCVEPDPENFQLLQKNLSPYQRVIFENSGIWSSDTKLKVFDKYNLGKWGMMVEEDLVSGNVNAISINSLLKKNKLEFVDILKLDIETSEKQVFLANYEEWLPKVRMIIIEFHDRIEEGCAQPFFVAINKHFSHYSYSTQGENTIIINKDIV